MKNQVFVPTVAEFSDDIKTSLEIQKPLEENGYKSGLMLVIRGGRKGVTLDSTVSKQHKNLSALQNYDSPIITMLSNIPLEEIDFYHNPDHSCEHVKRGVDFAMELPVGTNRIVTFHLNSLVDPQEFAEKNETQWKNEFNKIIRPVLKDVARYGRNYGVEVKVETVPVPEFGDVPSTDERTYRGVKWNQLRNPFYMNWNWGFNELREMGLGICLDLCHNRTIYEIAKLGDTDSVLYPPDKEKFKGTSVIVDVACMDKNDLVHLNDGLSVYSSKKNMVHVEGVALGDGDINMLRSAINYLNNFDIPFVLEINETDFKNRPNTKKSIEYLLKKEDYQ